MSEPASPAALRVLLRTDDPVRRRGLAAMVEGAGHLVVTEAPDVLLCDLARDAAPPAEAEAPVVVLTSAAGGGCRSSGSGAGWVSA